MAQRSPPAGAMRMPRPPGVAQQVERVRQQRLLRRLRVGGAGDKGGIGAILDQPAHEIGQQFMMRPHRRIDPARNARSPSQSLVQRFAHAMQALKLVILPRAGANNNGGGGQGVMGGELRKKRRGGKQGLGAGQIIEIGHGFPRKYREIGQSALLRALDLAVPIGALDQPHHKTPVVARPPAPRHGRSPPAPASGKLVPPIPARPNRARRVGGDAAEQVQRKLQAVRLFRIDGQPEIGMLRKPRQLEQTRRQFFATRSAEIAS